jgi:hypothetical protein
MEALQLRVADLCSQINATDDFSKKFEYSTQIMHTRWCMDAILFGYINSRKRFRRRINVALKLALLSSYIGIKIEKERLADRNYVLFHLDPFVRWIVKNNLPDWIRNSKDFIEAFYIFNWFVYGHTNRKFSRRTGYLSFYLSQLPNVKAHVVVRY